MNDYERTIRYFFLLGFALIVLAYYAGANKLLGTAFAGANQLDLTATGRDSQGRFGAYPANAPTS